MDEFDQEFARRLGPTEPDEFDAEFEARAKPAKPRGPQQYTRYSGINDPAELEDTPGPQRGPEPRVNKITLGRPTELESAEMGFKADGDRGAAAREMFPAAKNVYVDKDGTVTVEQPDGQVLNFEKPDYGHAIAGALRGLSEAFTPTPPGVETDRSLREEGLVGDLIRQNAAASLPHIATRGAANVAAQYATGGMGVLAQALGYGVANGAVPVLNSAINEHTAGGDSQTGSEIGGDAVVDALIGAGSVLVPAGIARGAERYTSAGRMNRALRELMHQEGQTNPELASMLNMTDEALPVQSLQNEDNALLLRRRLKNPKIAAVNSAAEENVARMGEDAASARETAQQGYEDANSKVLAATLRAKEQIRLARNTASVATNSADEAAAEMTARDQARRAAQDAEYNAKVAKQGEEYTAQARQHAEEVAKIREANAQEQIRANQERARSTLAAKFQPPVEQQPIPPKPVRPAKPEKPTRAPKEARPVADPYQEPARDELNAAVTERDAAKVNAARTNREYQSVDDMQKSLKKSLRKIQTAKSDTFGIGKNVVRMGAAYATGGKTLALEALYRGGKALFSNRATLKILSDPKLLRQAEELAATGRRLQQTPASPEAEGFARRLSEFIAETEAD